MPDRMSEYITERMSDRMSEYYYTILYIYATRTSRRCVRIICQAGSLEVKLPLRLMLLDSVFGLVLKQLFCGLEHFLFSIIYGIIPSHWLIFFKMVKTTNRTRLDPWRITSWSTSSGHPKSGAAICPVGLRREISWGLGPVGSSDYPD